MFLVRNIVFLNFIKQSRSTPDQDTLLRQISHLHHRTIHMIEQAPLNRGRTTLPKNRFLPIQETNSCSTNHFGSELVKCVTIKLYCKTCWNEKSRNIPSDLFNPFFSVQAALNFLSPLRACLRAWLYGFCFLTSIRQRYF